MNVPSFRPNPSQKSERSVHGRSLSERWAFLHAQAGEIAQMANLAPEPLDLQCAHFSKAIKYSSNHARSVAERGVLDIEAMLEIGIQALGQIESKGQCPHSAALALWREFYHAREAVVAVMMPEVA